MMRRNPSSPIIKLCPVQRSSGYLRRYASVPDLVGGMMLWVGICVAVLDGFVWQFWMDLCGSSGWICVAVLDGFVWQFWMGLCGSSGWICVAVLDGFVWQFWMDLCGSSGWVCVAVLDGFVWQFWMGLCGFSGWVCVAVPVWICMAVPVGNSAESVEPVWQWVLR